MRLSALDDTKPRRSQKCSGGQHALIIGASSAGLLAARILSDYFEQVTVVERDQLPWEAQVHKGIPQGNHVHLLMGKGAAIMAELFPDLFPALRADGALLLAPTDDFRWFHFGNWKLQFSGPLRLHSQSRPLLEYHIHHRVANLPNVCLYENCEVLGLIGDPDHRRGITGVSMRYGRGNAQHQGYFPTNLVVDASGRGSLTPSWLTVLGYPPVEETLVKIDVGYASRIYQRPDPAPSEWRVLGIYPWPLEMKRFGYIFPIEGNRWIVTLSGCLRDHPPIDEAGFLEFARSLAQPHIYEAIKHAIPLSPISLHKFPADRRRHYERLPSMPDGLVVLGDAACSFNPVYGQGMTVAALEAMTLGTCLEQHLRSHAANMTGFPQRFQKALASVVEVPWLFAICEDFRYAQTEGHRPVGLRLLQGYTQRVCRLMATDPFATQSFYEVLNMLKKPSALFHPRILLPALLAPGRDSVVATSRSPSALFPGGLAQQESCSPAGQAFSRRAAPESNGSH